MALDATAAASVATSFIASQTQLAAMPPPAVALLQASLTDLITAIFAGIVANAVVSPVGVPPMSNGAGAVAGTGKVL